MGSFSRKLKRAPASALPSLSAQLERFAEPLVAQSHLIEGMTPDDLSNLVALGWNMGLFIPDSADTDTVKVVSDMIHGAFAGELPDNATAEQTGAADLFITLMTSMVELRRSVFAADRRSVASCTVEVTPEGYRIEAVEGTAVQEKQGKPLPS
ncbi:MAG: hypothetical protein EOO75_07715 [Myxococcales bacterium]|nr:MAG: hypothetical protein EOO75_07715 [Myxococcales bacterium]